MLKGLFVLPVLNHTVDVPFPWGKIQPPPKSYFPGFDPPSDSLRWNQALLQAWRGEQVLLSRVLKVIKTPFDLHQGDEKFKWIHRVAEHHVSIHTNWLDDIADVSTSQPDKAPIVMLGFSKFEKSGKYIYNI